MRKLWIRKRAVSTMIGGIIVLTLILTALGTMVLVSRQYDLYQNMVNEMQQNDMDRFSENLVGMFPGLYLSKNGPSGLKQYVMNVSNYGTGTQIARIYINSSSSGCSSTVCILDPISTPAPYKFRASDRIVNPGEFFHQVVLWLPLSVTLPETPGSNTVMIVTTRGRAFSFQSPFPIVGPSAPGGGSGGTGINVGPLVIWYRPILVTYSATSGGSTYGPPVPDDNGWIFPAGGNTYVIFFVKIANQADVPVTITSQSLLQVQQYGTAGANQRFYLIAPMDPSVCSTLAAYTSNKDLWCGSGGAYNGGNTYPSGTGAVTGYKFNGSGSNPYIVPQASTNWVCCGQPIYLLFSASGAGGTFAQKIPLQPGHPAVFYTYLNLIFQYNSYLYGVNLPFIVFCASTSGPNAGSFGTSCPP